MSRAREFADLASSADAGGITGKNLIINGAMQVAQRSTSLTVGDSTEYKTLDRFAIAINGTTAGRATMSQATDAPSGFGNSMKFDVTTADTSIGASEAFGFAQRIEGQNLQQLAKGTADAKVSTLSFYAKGTAKTYIVEVRDANSRQVSATFNVTTSWQRFEIQIPADTSGTIANDNSTELQILWWLHAGSDYTSGTLNTSWGTSTNANRMVGCDSIFDTVGNTFYITGIQLEVGEQATPFEHRSFGDELARCQRYYEKSARYGQSPLSTAAADLVASAGTQGATTTGEVNYGSVFFNTHKRTAPTLTLHDEAGTTGKVTRMNYGVAGYNNSIVTNNIISEGHFSGLSGSGSTACGVKFGWQADAEL